MNAALAMETSRLVDWGWDVKSQTDTTAFLETRGPFNWLFFAILILLFPFIGGLLYIAFWLIVSRVDVFLTVNDGGTVAASGDTWFVERQAAHAEASKRLAADIKQQGFWKVMGPSIISVIIGLVLWFLLIWALIELFD
jgi:hypothetical protein